MFPILTYFKIYWTKCCELKLFKIFKIRNKHVSQTQLYMANFAHAAYFKYCTSSWCLIWFCLFRWQTFIDRTHLLRNLLCIFFSFIKTFIIWMLNCSIMFWGNYTRKHFQKYLRGKNSVESIFHCFVCSLCFVIIRMKNCPGTSLVVKNISCDYRGLMGPKVGHLFLELINPRLSSLKWISTR